MSRRAAILAAAGIVLVLGGVLGWFLWPEPPGSLPLSDPTAPQDDPRNPLLTPGPRPELMQPRAGQGALSLPGDVVDAAGAPVVGAVVTAQFELGPGLTPAAAPAPAATTGSGAESAAEEPAAADVVDDAQAGAAPSSAADDAPDDAAGEPATLVIDTEPAIVAITDAAGVFTLAGLRPGRYRLRVEADGIFPSEVRFFEVPAERVRLVVAREVEVVGRVVEGAAPAPGVPVTLLENDVILARTSSDEDGGFRFAGLSEGVFQVWAGAGERASPAMVAVRLGAGPFEPITLALEPAVVVTGRVIDRQSESGLRAVVALAALGPEQPMRYGQSDSSGGFRIEAVPPGRWSIQAWSPGYLSREAVEFEAALTNPVRPVIALSPGGVLAGQVVDGAGTPVAGATVRARGRDSAGQNTLVSAQGDLDRVRRLRGDPPLSEVPAGTRFLARGELGVLLGPIPFPPPPGAATVRVAEPALGPGDDTATSGEDDAAPVSAEAAIAALADGEDLGVYVTDTQGQFRITGVPPGSFRVIASHPDYAEGSSDALPVALGQRRDDVRVVLRAGVVLVGTVENNRGERIIGAALAAEPAGASAEGAGGAGVGGARVLAVTGTDGRYRLGPVTGRVRVSVSAAGHGDAERVLSVAEAEAEAAAAGRAPDERVEDFVLTVADAELAGRVRDSSGFAVRGARVRITGAAGATPALSAEGRAATTDDAGRFAIAALAPGRYRVEISHPGFPTRTAEAGTEEGAELSLVFGGGIDGQVRDQHTRAAIAGARVLGTGPGGARRELSAGDDGGFSLVPVVAGVWTLSASAPGYVPAAPLRVEVAAATEPAQVTVRDVRLDLARGATVAGTVRDENGQRVAGARVRAGQAEGRSDAEGGFRLSDVPTGDTRITAELEARRGSTTVSLGPGDEVVTLEIRIE
ncbi:carboxypeptidase-like regulatory domain-containing protein [Haliangium ochraceum]|uniref:carboxypeptidase-like regulatory domain-containing protein n=1 Tax=Haliangium ochraceum TaxID=80816 RepID=UPI0005D476DF|nr:carboxypeptidase-like regulatory domain-containing protein [Haliangium ochraceum]